MSKKLLLWLVILFALTLDASAALTATGPGSITINDLSSPESIIFTLRNTGSSDIIVNSFDIIGFNVSQYTITPDKFIFNKTVPFVIAAGSPETINLTLNLAGTNAYATTYNGKINITTNETGTYNEYLLSVVVAPNPNLAVNNISLETAQGQGANAALILTNRGNTDISAIIPSPVTLTSAINSSNRLTATITITSLIIHYKSSNSTAVVINIPENAAKENYTGNIIISHSGKLEKSAVSVNAVEPRYSITAANIDIGNVDQNETISKTITITNNGNVDLRNVVLRSNIAARYNATFSPIALSDLRINESRDITATVLIPTDEPTGHHSIGTFDVLTDKHNFTSAFSLQANVLGSLLIDDLDIIIDKDIDGNRVSATNLQDGETVGEKARPGSKIEVDIKLRNQFSDKSDIDIDNIVVTLKIKDIDQGEDLEVESDEFDLDADNTQRETLEFDVPLILEADTYEMDIHVEGEDSNSVTHEIDWKLFLKVDKKSHDVMIYKAEVDPSTIRCVRKANLNIQLANTGKREEDEVKLEAKNSELGLNFLERQINIDKTIGEDDIYEKTIPIELYGNINAGTYPIIINAYYDNTILDDAQIVNLNVEDCKLPASTEEETKKEPAEKTPAAAKEETPVEPEIAITEPTDETEEIIEESVEKSALTGKAGAILLIAVNIIVVIGVLALVAKFLLKPSD